MLEILKREEVVLKKSVDFHQVATYMCSEIYNK